VLYQLLERFPMRHKFYVAEREVFSATACMWPCSGSVVQVCGCREPPHIPYSFDADTRQLGCAAAGPPAHWPAADACFGAQDDFWSNVGRYGSYFFSVLLGTAYTAVKPIGGLLRKPVTAVFTLAALAALAVFVTSTVRAMLGVGAEFEVRRRGPVADGPGARARQAHAACTRAALRMQHTCTVWKAGWMRWIMEGAPARSMASPGTRS